MLRKIFSSLFVATWLAATLSAGLVWLDHYRGYEAETQILIIDHTATGEVGPSLSELMGTLSFYNAVLSRNANLDDAFQGASPDVRKARWQSIASLSREDASGVYTLTVVADEGPEATLLARETIGTLVETAGRYFNAKTDFDVRIVDGPVVKPVVRSWVTYLSVSLLTGFVISFIFFALLALLDRVSQKDKHGAAPPLGSEKEMRISPETFRPAKPAHWPMSTGPFVSREEEEGLVSPEASREVSQPRPVSKAHAPANLPILEEEAIAPLAAAADRLVEEDVAEALKTRQENEASVAVEAAPSEPQTREPSEEEYKRRLNELLSGKMK